MADVLGRLNRAEIDASADPKWAVMNEVYRLLASTRPSALSRRQKVAQLALFYDNEVNNGGHLQYFHNQGLAEADALIAALTEIGAHDQCALFVEALDHVRDHPVAQADSLEDYAERAAEQEFREIDSDYYECAQSVGNDLLPAYVEAHLEEFVALE